MAGPWIQGEDTWIEAGAWSEERARWWRGPMQGDTIQEILDTEWGTHLNDQYFDPPDDFELFDPPPGQVPPSSTYASASFGAQSGKYTVTWSPLINISHMGLIGPHIPAPIPEADWPAGAIGYEWEHPHGEWLTRDFTVLATVRLNPTFTSHDPIPQPIRLMGRAAPIANHETNTFPSWAKLHETWEPPPPPPYDPVSDVWAEMDSRVWPTTIWANEYLTIPLTWTLPGYIVETPEMPPTTYGVSLLPVPDWAITGDHGGQTYSFGAHITVKFRRDFRPPRHRFIYGGLRRLRQRQTLPGADSWPLRQRQNGAHTGSWTTRQRQTGI